MYYQPPRSLGMLVGAALIAWSLVVAALAFGVVAAHGVSLVGAAASIAGVMALVVALMLGYWVYSLATLSYALDRNGLVIRWGLTRQIVPLEAIERLVPGTSVGVPLVAGVEWPGHHVGRAEINRIGEVLFYSTHKTPDEVLYVMTTERNYGISVTDPASFARQIQVRQDLGPTATVTHHVERTWPTVQGFATDYRGWALAVLALVSGAAVWVALAMQYESLPAAIALQFPMNIVTPFVETHPKSVLLAIPRTATIILAINLALGLVLYSWDRTVARMMLAAAIALQIGFLAALQVALDRV